METVELVARTFESATRETFARRVEEQGAFLAGAIEDGTLDNDGFALGLEIEVYGVDANDCRLQALPEAAVTGPCGKEIGLHNAEINTEPAPFTDAGVRSQARQVEETLTAVRELLAEDGQDVVLDAMWTVPPSVGSYEYLSAGEETDGVFLAANVRADPRYYALDNEAVRLRGGPLTFDVPGAALEFPSILFESLATSIQPHLQIPDVETFPAYYAVAIRTLGPVLALSTNSPFLPGDLYNDVDDPRELLAETHHELRIAAFEQSMNQTDRPKVCFPEDVARTTDGIDQIVADPTIAPFLSEWADGDGSEAEETFRDRFPEFDHKRGTHWRWLRPVVGGDPVAGASDERSLRIEYRPIPTQPTVTDLVGMLCLVAGAVRGLVVADHPLATLDWTAARDSFRSAVEEGLDADLAWVTADGEVTADHEVIFEELFAYARRGLREQGVGEATIAQYLDPIEARWESRTTPSRWKIERVREALADGQDLETALVTMQREYVRRSRASGSFADWL